MGGINWNFDNVQKAYGTRDYEGVTAVEGQGQTGTLGTQPGGRTRC
jgi:hypothetical protein